MNGVKTLLGFVLYAVAGGLYYLGMYEVGDAVKQLAEALIGIGLVHKIIKGQIKLN